MGYLIRDRQYGNSEEGDEARSEKLKLGGGAQFLAYISPSNDTAKCLVEWQIKLEHQNSDWRGTITSEQPRQSLRTPGLSGFFKVTVTVRMFNNSVEIQLQPQAGSQSNIVCEANCAAMIGIVAVPGGSSARYWTVWNAFCKPEKP